MPIEGRERKHVNYIKLSISLWMDVLASIYKALIKVSLS
jgi:hypothetical protein